MATVLKQQDSGWEQVLYMALELSNSKWKLAFSAGEGIRKKSMDAGDLAALEALLAIEELIAAGPVVAMEWFTIENGRIQRRWGARDAASQARQLGIPLG